jgi:hypothetical protein
MSKFAVIIAELNSSELGRIVSTHRTEAAAVKAQPDVPGAYVAHRKPDGEWERYLDARDRRETPPSLGRPAEMEGGKRVNVYLDADSLARAAAKGNGNVSEGIRLALKQ